MSKSDERIETYFPWNNSECLCIGAEQRYRWMSHDKVIRSMAVAFTLTTGMAVATVLAHIDQAAARLSLAERVDVRYLPDTCNQVYADQCTATNNPMYWRVTDLSWRIGRRPWL